MSHSEYPSIMLSGATGIVESNPRAVDDICGIANKIIVVCMLGYNKIWIVIVYLKDDIGVVTGTSNGKSNIFRKYNILYRR